MVSYLLAIHRTACYRKVCVIYIINILYVIKYKWYIHKKHIFLSQKNYIHSELDATCWASIKQYTLNKTNSWVYCLHFHSTQLHQEPSETNPIFLPSDSKTDWLLAKFFLKNAYALMHQSITHLMRTHFMVEAYSVAAFRCLPEIHPIYKV